MAPRHIEAPFHDATEKHTKELYEFLKEGEDTNPKTSTDPTDETRMVSGEVEVRPEQPEPADQPPKDPTSFSDAAEKGHEETQQGVLGSALAKQDEAAKANQAVISKAFSHGSSGQFESASPMLERKSKLSHVRSSTLMSRVIEKTGRH